MRADSNGTGLARHTVFWLHLHNYCSKCYHYPISQMRKLRLGETGEFVQNL